MTLKTGALVIVAIVVAALATGATPGGNEKSDEALKCANLVYAGTKSSVCFSDKFLTTVKRETNCRPAKKVFRHDETTHTCTENNCLHQSGIHYFLHPVRLVYHLVICSGILRVGTIDAYNR